LPNLFVFISIYLKLLYNKEYNFIVTVLSDKDLIQSLKVIFCERTSNGGIIKSIISFAPAFDKGPSFIILYIL